MLNTHLLNSLCLGHDVLLLGVFADFSVEQKCKLYVKNVQIFWFIGVYLKHLKDSFACEAETPNCNATRHTIGQSFFSSQYRRSISFVSPSVCICRCVGKENGGCCQDGFQRMYECINGRWCLKYYNR